MMCSSFVESTFVNLKMMLMTENSAELKKDTISIAVEFSSNQFIILLEISLSFANKLKDYYWITVYKITKTNLLEKKKGIFVL